MKKIINFLFFLIFLIFPFGQLFSLHPSILSILGEVRVQPLDLLVGLLVGIWLAWQLISAKKIKLPPGSQFIFAFTLIGLLSWLVNSKNYTQSEQLVALLYLVRWTAYAGLYFLIFNFNFKLEILNSKLELPSLLLISSILAAFFGLLQYGFFPDMRNMAATNWDPHYYRVVSTFFDPGFTGMIYVLGLILLISQFYEAFAAFNLHSFPGRIKERKYLILYTLYLILYSALALTYSRSSYLAYLVAMGVIAFFKKSWRFFVFVLILGVFTLLILPQPGGEGVKFKRSSTIWARLGDYQHALAIIHEHPLLGVGFNFYRYAQRDAGFLAQDWEESRAAAGSSSSLLFVFATTGVFGFLTYLFLHLFLISKNLSSWSSAQTSLTLASLASLLALLLHSLFNHSLFYPWIMLWMWALLGVSLKKKKIKG